MKKTLQKIITYSYIAAVLIPALFSFTTVTRVGADPLNLTLQPDPSIMKDTMLKSSNTGTNYGTNTSLGVGESNAATETDVSLLKFDGSYLPSDISITAVTLSLWVKTDLSDNARTMRVMTLLRSWVETEATWHSRQSGSQFWGTDGAYGAADIATEEVGNVALANNLAVNTKVDISLDPEMVMKNLVKDNYFGFKLQMDTNDNDQYLFYSSDEATNTMYRPQLYIEYEIGDTPPAVDWYCREVITVGTGQSCVNVAANTPIASPIYITGNMTYFTTAQSDSWNDPFTRPEVGVSLGCTPYPLCKNDYPIYYKVQMDVTWTSRFAETATHPKLFSYLDIPGGTDVNLPTEPCGTAGTTGTCSVVKYGVIDVGSIGTANNSASFEIALNTIVVAGATIDYTIYHQVTFSLTPVAGGNCQNTYMVLEQTAYTIDPTIETPLGPEGTPADDQIYTTEIGQIYMVRTNDGPWDDGTSGRYDAAVSVDGSTWVTLEEFSTTALCVDVDPFNSEYLIVYFTATTDTFYIRANDTTGDFGDNTNNLTTPFQYRIGQAYTLVDQECESQFTYDEEDVFATIPLLNSSDEDGERAADEFTHYDVFQAGEWYAVKVDSGEWSDDGGDPTTALQYVFTGLTASGGNWEPLAEGSPLVQCEHTDGVTVFVQAIDTTLRLRADDGDDDFSNNTGTMSIKIFHAIRERPTEVCEMRFALDDLVRSDSVDGNQSNGKVFALAVGTALTDQNNTDEFFLSGGLVPGAWYALETTGGPWGYLANYHYDMAVAQESAGSIGKTPEDDWEPLADWSMADCNIETDKLGHRLVYFQIPVATASQWKLRVNGSTSWFLNEGGMSWNLYRARDLGFIPDGICDYTYSSEDLITPTPQTVQANQVNGASLALLPNTFYAVEILGASYQWFEESGGDPHTDMEISLNNGQTWGDIPGSNVLCALSAGDNVVFFLHTGAASQVKMRVNSTTFDDNTGLMGWNIYTADAGSSITGCTTEGYSISTLGNVLEWIPVQDETGRMITSTSAGYAEISGLVAGNTYVIETSRGGWMDGETEIEHFGAEISSDGGATWHGMDGTNPDVNCWEVVGMLYRKIEVTAVDGQIWKIRVADSDTATFADNTGNLAYTIKGVLLPDDELVQGEFNLMGCNTPAIAPSLSEVDSFTGLANYLAGWFDYTVASVVNFFALCPQHIDSFQYFGTAIEDREPFATLNEFEGVLNDVKNELNAYDWDASEDYSVLDKSPAESAAMIQQYIFGPLPDDSPWVNGDLVDLHAVDTTDYYESCTWAAAEYVGPRLAGGVCFASNWAKEVGFTFYIQLGLDVAVMFACIKSVLDTLTTVLSLLTGVNLTKGR